MATSLAPAATTVRVSRALVMTLLLDLIMRRDMDNHLPLAHLQPALCAQLEPRLRRFACGPLRATSWVPAATTMRVSRRWS